NAGQTMMDLILRLEEYSTIAGIVRENGRPFSGARVNAGGSMRAVTQRDGTFVIRRVPHVEVTVELSEGRCRGLSPRAVRVDRRRIDGVRIDVQAMSAISGRVLFDGHGVEGATVRVGDEPDRQSTKANARGAYVLRGLPAGTYRVTAESGDGR